MSRHRWFVLPITLLLPLAATSATGGWAVITLDDLPEHFTTGQPVELAFTVRQHGMTPMDDLEPIVTARSGDRDTRVNARHTGKPGRYAAPLTLPSDGDWRVTIDTRFAESRVTLLPIRAASYAHASNGNGNGAAKPAEAAKAHAASRAWERGRALFIAKGCITCHVHSEATGAQVVPVGPELTQRRFAADYLAMFLADPSIRPATSDLRMPDLDLDEAEIKALVAFINDEKSK